MPIVAKTGQWRGENRLKKRNGELVDVDQSIFTIHDEMGNVKYFATIMVDITERKQARDALYQSEMLFQEFMS